MRYAYRTTILVAALLSTLDASRGAAQQRDSLDTREHQVQRARSGAGLRVGLWESPAPVPSTATVSSTPAFEGYWQKGIDRHLVLETGLGVWVRNLRDASSGSHDAVYLVPMTTTVKMFPFTGPEARLEPWLAGGAGFTLGIDDQQSSGGGLLGTTPSNQTMMTLGFTLRGATGLEFHFSRAFGIQAGVGYQYTQMFTDLAGGREFKGLQAGGGLTYRFQF